MKKITEVLRLAIEGLKEQKMSSAGEFFTFGN
jgi:hypothetical protein